MKNESPKGSVTRGDKRHNVPKIPKQRPKPEDGGGQPAPKK